MRVLLTNFSEIILPGGVHKVIREIVKNLAKKGHDVTVLQLNPLNRPNEEIYKGFKIVRIDSRFGKYFYGLSPEVYSYLKKHFKELHPDIVHVHGYHTLFSPEVIWTIRKIDKNIPIVFSPHFGIFSHSSLLGKVLWKPYNKLMGQRIVKMVDLIIVASEFEKTTFKNEFPWISQDKIKTIPHGVNKIEIYNKRKKNKQDKDTIKLLYGGYLLELKGVHYIIYSLYELVNTYGVTNVRLEIVGEGPYKEELITLVKKLNLEKFVDFKPFLDHSIFLERTKQADIFLLLSKSENYGITVAEALALGTPTIVTKRTALKEFLNEPGCFGVDYPPDPREVAELILKIVNSDVKVGPFSKKIRTWKEVVKDYENVYMELTGG